MVPIRSYFGRVIIITSSLFIKIDPHSRNKYNKSTIRCTQPPPPSGFLLQSCCLSLINIPWQLLRCLGSQSFSSVVVCHTTLKHVRTVSIPPTTGPSPHNNRSVHNLVPLHSEIELSHPAVFVVHPFGILCCFGLSQSENIVLKFFRILFDLGNRMPVAILFCHN